MLIGSENMRWPRQADVLTARIHTSLKDTVVFLVDGVTGDTCSFCYGLVSMFCYEVTASVTHEGHNDPCVLH